MRQEDKELLLEDLCTRLPYGVKVDVFYDKKKLLREMGLGTLHDFIFNDVEIKPYLRPLSSMTWEEHQDWIKYSKADYDCEFKPEPTFSLEGCHLSIDWLNAHHFDYRGLIEKGLAIAATKENNPYKN